MTKQLRVTIMLDMKIQTKLRAIQAARIKGTSKSVSFSAVLNEALAERLGVKLE